VIKPIIPDESTLIASLRTGKIDYNWSIDARHWNTLDKTAPELKSIKHPGSSGFMIYMEVDEPPLDNLEVRRALSIGTDREAFNDLLGVGPLPILFYPVIPSTAGVYTPLEDLPEESRMLYEYNPTKAKQMIIDAGYPDGLELDYYAEGEPFALDRASLLKFQWEKIGVDVTIKSFDTVTHDKHLYDRTFNHTLGARHGSPDPTHMLEWSTTDGAWSWTGFSNEWYDEKFAMVKAEPDDDKRNQLMKELNLFIISQVHTLGISPTLEGHYWWPWIKNYYGETNVSDKAVMPVLALAWIDRDLKADMGY
jgi:peptide/nickel transport system substrate-binding protein